MRSTTFPMTPGRVHRIPCPAKHRASAVNTIKSCARSHGWTARTYHDAALDTLRYRIYMPGEAIPERTPGRPRKDAPPPAWAEM